MVELIWSGKDTSYNPLPIKELHTIEAIGNSSNANLLIRGDNESVIPALIDKYRSKVDLIYIDPPFNTGRKFSYRIQIGGDHFSENITTFNHVAYQDNVPLDEYLQWFYQLLLTLRELLSDTGSIYVHVDYRVAPYTRLLLDEVLGNFINEIIWKRTNAIGLAYKRCGTLHDTLYWYSKNKEYTFNMQYHAYEEEYLKRARKDEKGRLYIPQPIGNPGLRPNLYYEYKGYLPPSNGYRWTYEKMEAVDRQGRLIFPKKKTGRIQFKQYLDEMNGIKLQDIRATSFL